MAETSRRTALFCPHCAVETDCIIIRRPTTVTFRGKEYRAEEEFARCSACGQEFDMFGLVDPLKLVHEQYRSEHGYPTAHEIQALRQRMRLTEEEFARLIGATKSTVRFYERGAIPREEHADALKALVQRHADAGAWTASFEHILQGQADAEPSLASCHLVAFSLPAPDGQAPSPPPPDIPALAA